MKIKVNIVDKSGSLSGTCVLCTKNKNKVWRMESSTLDRCLPTIEGSFYLDYAPDYYTQARTSILQRSGGTPTLNIIAVSLSFSSGVFYPPTWYAEYDEIVYNNMVKELLDREDTM